MPTYDKHKINTLVDKLTLESLSLMEQHITTKIQLEECMVAGESHIAKARYIMGHKQVSQLQLPTEDSNEFLALAVVNKDDTQKDVVQENLFDLEYRIVQKPSRKLENGAEEPVVVNPVTWFGVLVPQSLHMAQEQFKKTVHLSVKSVNIQQKLSDCLRTIAQLNELIN